jgi:hypothetical protein
MKIGMKQVAAKPAQMNRFGRGGELNTNKKSPAVCIKQQAGLLEAV